jgi:hypothetical protein
MTSDTIKASNALITELEKNGTKVETIPVKEIPGNGPLAVGRVAPLTNAPASTPAVTGKMPPPRPVTPVPAKPVTNVAALARSVGPARPKNIISGNTSQLEHGYFHGVVYSETNARKTTTAASFESPEWVRIVGTRNPEQLIPLRELGYTYSVAPDATALDYLLRHPEHEWPDWAAKDDPEHRRTLVLDDGTEAVNMLLDDNEVIDGRVVKNQMRTHVAAGKALRDLLIKTALRKPLNFVMTALAKAKESPVAPNEEIYGPNLPPAMLELVMTEFEFVFYINKKKWCLHTTDSNFTYSSERSDANGKPMVVPIRRTIYGKSKLGVDAAKAGLIKPEECMDLADIWRRVRGKTK